METMSEALQKIKDLAAKFKLVDIDLSTHEIFEKYKDNKFGDPAVAYFAEKYNVFAMTDKELSLVWTLEFVEPPDMTTLNDILAWSSYYDIGLIFKRVDWDGPCDIKIIKIHENVDTAEVSRVDEEGNIIPGSTNSVTMTKTVLDVITKGIKPIK